MDNVELLTFADDQALAAAAAKHFLELLRSQALVDGQFSVGLSGGRIAQTFFSAAAALLSQQRTTIHSTHFFWGDERCVPPGDPESNFRIADQLLLHPLRIPLDQIHRIRGEEPPESAAAEAANELCRQVPKDPQGQPVVDLLFLGMGEDGHVASLFPQEPEAMMEDPAVYRAVLATKPPPRRITLGYRAIAAAKQVWVLAAGAGKQNALHQSLSPHGVTPLARVLRICKAARIYTDVEVKKL